MLISLVVRKPSGGVMGDGMEMVWKVLGGFVASLGVIFLIIGAFVGFGFTVFLLFILLVVGAVCAFNVFSAKADAIKKGSADALGGLCRIYSWDPTEGVLFLKNKVMDFVDDDPTDGGGIRPIFPLLGQELACKVPLEIQTLNFQDNEVLTKEFLPLSIKGTIYWNIVDLNVFYISVSKEVHAVDSSGQHVKVSHYKSQQMNTAYLWLQAMAEEKTRAVVSNIGTGLLIADRLVSEVPDILPKDSALYVNKTEASTDYRSATEGLAAALTHSVSDAVSKYGIRVERIALQEVNLPPAIYAAAVEACKSSYGPIKARAEAIAKKMSLQAEVDVLGADVVGLRQIAENVPALAFQDVLGATFTKLAASMGNKAIASR
jgi:regulator of protease activity HflC (stomatin/prohibitin superfamily)